MDPTTPVKNDDGSWGFPKFSDTKNPVAEAHLTNDLTKRPIINGSGFVEIEPIKNLVLKSQINLGYDFTNRISYIPTFDIYPLQRNLTTRLTRSLSLQEKWDWQNTITYDTSIKNHDF